MHEIKTRYTIVIVTHNMQQHRVSDRTPSTRCCATRSTTLARRPRRVRSTANFRGPAGHRTQAYVTAHGVTRGVTGRARQVDHAAGDVDRWARAARSPRIRAISIATGTAVGPAASSATRLRAARPGPRRSARARGAGRAGTTSPPPAATSRKRDRPSARSALGARGEVVVDE